VKKIYVVAVLLLVAMLIVVAAVPKPGPTNLLVLRNKMLNQTASLSLSGLTNFYTYYLTAKAYPINVKYPTEWFIFNGTTGIKSNDTTYEVRSDFYEVVIYLCGQPGRKGVINLTHKTRLTFPLCDKSARINMGAPNQEKVTTSRYFPGYFDPEHACFVAAREQANAGWSKGNSVDLGGNFICSAAGTYNILTSYTDKYVGDGYSDGTTDGFFAARMNGAQIRWMLDLVNFSNGGVDIWH